MVRWISLSDQCSARQVPHGALLLPRNTQAHERSHLFVGNFVDVGMVLNSLRAVRELEGVVRLIHAQERRCDGADDGDLRVASEARLEQASELGVSIRNVPHLVA